tara:strand:+ start:217 stop:453 length:237 start_codon:yes stop_codon:yes gene_type:complete
LDPLDPLTEIIKSGQAFSSAIALERFLWVMIGFFFIGALSTSILNGIKHQDLFGNKSFMSGFKTSKKKDKFPKELSED